MRLSEQGYYNAIVYDVPPEKLPNLFSRAGGDNENDMVEWVTEAITFINDRMEEEMLTHATSDGFNAQEMLYRGFILESVRHNLMEDEWEPHFDPFRFHN